MNDSPSELESASVLQRFTAHAIDYAVTAVIVALPAFAPQNSTLHTFLSLSAFLVAVAYRLLADGVCAGAAIGKRILGIYVVDAATRRPCSIGQAAIRMGILLLLPPIYFIEAILLACDGQQRWGDRVARTYVLRRHPKPAPVTVAPSRPLNLAGLGDTLSKLKNPEKDG